ncbi:LCP family protein [Actinospica sp.]|jgi:LCP family protein required for cell wall assembly|uniref:LCP family protein n=1 Tax=Actinospica sp. TaxID=1872142 RepID=UPI002C056CC6|nr:LCP family protein [Actinospica sp.]HWG24624.1 LCP family protein [Actinospica sp.]
MSDGRSWYPGDDDPRYDPYAPPQQPPGYGQRPPQGQRQQPYGPGPQGQGQGHGQGQGGQGRRQGPGPYQNPQGPGQAPGYGQAPPRQPQGGQYPDSRGVPRPRPAQPWDEEPRDRAEVWSAPGADEPDYDEELAGGGRSRRRRGAAAGTGPGRQTSASTGPSHVNDDLDLDEVDPNGRAQHAWAKQQELANRPKSKVKQATKWGALGMGLVVLAAAGFGVYIYQTTVGSIKHTALMPSGMTQASLPADPYGHVAQNILLMGSDTRNSASDCKLGGDCIKNGQNPGANADSEMILHVSAEGTDATILSIPRDTVASLPQCSVSNGTTSLTGAYTTYQINSALQDGPECQVAAVHALTGITLTGYMLFDFSGIVTMSNALGGVPVCVTKSVSDKNSGLNLAAGDSVIKGQQALEFLRTRDSFFDGSDLGREQATHYFLAQLIQTLRKSMNFTDLNTLISIGQAAAGSMTVSDNYTGLTNLEGLVESLNRVPTNNITMLTMPWEYDPNNQSRVIPSSAAKSVFAALQDSTSFTSTSSSKSSSGAAKTTAASSPTAAASTSSAASVTKSQVPVNVYNADGVSGRATTIKQALISGGFSNSVSSGNAQSVSSSQVTYDPNEVTQADADAVAAALGISTSEVSATTSWKGVSVFIGQDFTSGTKLTAAASVATPSVNTSGAASAPADSHESFASGSANECIPVESGNLSMAYK